jgi:hypothetical protein
LNPLKVVPNHPLCKTTQLFHKGRVDSWLLVLGSQTASLSSDPSCCHNLCCRCPNGPCEPIFDMYTLITFQWYKEHPNARCFDPCNWILKF